MRDEKRNILKQLLSGAITGKEAAQRLNITEDNTLHIAIATSDGFYTYQGQRGLTRKEVNARSNSEFVLVVSEDQADLIETVNILNNEISKPL